MGYYNRLVRVLNETELEIEVTDVIKSVEDQLGLVKVRIFLDKMSGREV